MVPRYLRAISKLDLGEFNFIVAMTIAVIKGTLVVLFFMDVRHGTPLTKLFVCAGFFWMAILLVFVLSGVALPRSLPWGWAACFARKARGRPNTWILR